MIIMLGDMLELNEHDKDLHVGQAMPLVNNQVELNFGISSFLRGMRYNTANLPQPPRAA